MSQSDDLKYTAPCAVRLSDATTGTFSCGDGPEGNEDVCASGFGVLGQNRCLAGSNVQNF
ncbi:MAG: hypothetical protein R6X12_07270 [bacterium]